MPTPFATTATTRRGASTLALVFTAGLTALIGVASAARGEDKDDPKAQIVVMYELQLAPTACQWKDAASPAKLDEKVAEMEKALGLTDEDKAKFKAAAADDVKKGTNCTDGMARSMYDEMAK